MPRNPHLQIGFVARAHALGGEVGVRLYDAGSDVLDVVDRLWAVPRQGEPLELAIESVRDTPKELLVAFAGISGRDAAERLVGAALYAFREDSEAPAEGEFFQGDLVGLRAVDEQGNALGEVVEIWETGPVPNLVIRAEGRPELVVPFADEFVPKVDLEQGVLVVRPPELLE